MCGAFFLGGASAFSGEKTLSLLLYQMLCSYCGGSTTVVSISSYLNDVNQLTFPGKRRRSCFYKKKAKSQ